LLVFQVSQAYNNTDFTFVLNVHILIPFDIMLYIGWTQISCVAASGCIGAVTKVHCLFDVICC
jgi:hypothetical protein